MGKYIFSYIMAIAGFLSLAASFLFFNIIEEGDPTAMKSGVLVFVFSMAIAAVALFSLSFYIFFLS